MREAKLSSLKSVYSVKIYTYDGFMTNYFLMLGSLRIHFNIFLALNRNLFNWKHLNWTKRATSYIRMNLDHSRIEPPKKQISINSSIPSWWTYKVNAFRLNTVTHKFYIKYMDVLQTWLYHDNFKTISPRLVKLLTQINYIN